MKRFAVCLLLSASIACGATFPTNHNTVVLDLSNRSIDWSDFLFTIRGYENQRFTFTVTNSSGYVDWTGYYGSFKASRRVSGGTNQVGILRAANEITVTASNLTFDLAATNIPPDGVYKCELMGFVGSTTNATLMVGHGTIEVKESLFDDEDGTFAWPSVTNMNDYLLITVAATTYLAIADYQTGTNTIIAMIGSTGTAAYAAATNVSWNALWDTNTILRTYLDGLGSSNAVMWTGKWDKADGLATTDVLRTLIGSTGTAAYAAAKSYTDTATNTIWTSHVADTNTIITLIGSTGTAAYAAATNASWNALWNTNTILRTYLDGLGSTNGSQDTYLAGLGSSNAVMWTGKWDKADGLATTDVLRTLIGSTGTAAYAAAKSYTDTATNTIWTSHVADTNSLRAYTDAATNTVWTSHVADTNTIITLIGSTGTVAYTAATNAAATMDEARVPKDAGYATNLTVVTMLTVTNDMIVRSNLYIGRKTRPTTAGNDPLITMCATGINHAGMFEVYDSSGNLDLRIRSAGASSGSILWELLDPESELIFQNGAYIECSGADMVIEVGDAKNFALQSVSNLGEQGFKWTESTGKIVITPTDGTSTTDLLRVVGHIRLENGGNVNEFSGDGTFAANSTNKVPVEKAVKTYVDTSTSSVWSATMTLVGSTGTVAYTAATNAAYIISTNAANTMIGTATSSVWSATTTLIGETGTVSYIASTNAAWIAATNAVAGGGLGLHKVSDTGTFAVGSTNVYGWRLGTLDGTNGAFMSDSSGLTNVWILFH